MKGFTGDGAFELGLQGWVGVCQEDEWEGYSRQRKQHKGLWCDSMMWLTRWLDEAGVKELLGGQWSHGRHHHS